MMKKGFLEVGLTRRGDEVVVNHPALLTDKDGNGYIIFSPQQARDFALLLIKHAALAAQNRTTQ